MYTGWPTELVGAGSVAVRMKGGCMLFPVEEATHCIPAQEGPGGENAGDGEAVGGVGGQGPDGLDHALEDEPGADKAHGSADVGLEEGVEAGLAHSTPSTLAMFGLKYPGPLRILPSSR